MNKERDILLSRAVKLAVRFHSGALDRYGSPYILHPMRVMERVASTDEKIIAVLHDVIEDCGVTSKMLCREGIPEMLVADIERLSRLDGEVYDDYIERVMTSRRAARVKIADLDDNMDIRRMTVIGDNDLDRLRRYHRSRRKLLDYLAKNDSENIRDTNDFNSEAGSAQSKGDTI